MAGVRKVIIEVTVFDDIQAQELVDYIHGVDMG
jgi:FtsZ-interacting cell division protein YlmF